MGVGLLTDACSPQTRLNFQGMSGLLTRAPTSTARSRTAQDTNKQHANYDIALVYSCSTCVAVRLYYAACLTFGSGFSCLKPYMS